MNKLYYTSNANKVILKARHFAKQHKLTYYYYMFNKNSMNEIQEIYNKYNNCVIMLVGVNKSPIADSLLKILENNTKNIHLFVTSNTFDIRPTIKARFDTIEVDSDKEFKTIQELLQYKNHNNLNYYIRFADALIRHPNKYTYENIILVNNIISTIRLCTNNVLWDELFDKLVGGIKC